MNGSTGAERALTPTGGARYNGRMTDSDALFTLTKAEAKALLAFASTDPARPWLCCVQFEPEHGCAVATDGHTLVRRTTSKRAGDAFMVSTADLAAAAKACPAKGEIEVTATALRAGGATVPVRPVDGHFPPYRSVLAASREETPSKTIGFDARLLARLALVQDACGRGQRLRLHLFGELDPQSFDCFSPTANWDGVIMPCRV